MRHELLVTAHQLTLMQAAARHEQVEIVRMIREGQPVDGGEPGAAQQRTLRTDLSNAKPLFCHPDMLIVLQLGAARVGYCLEGETGANGAKRKIARCHQGYHQLAATGRYTRYFPDVTKHPFGVLAVAPTRGYRDQMRKAISDRPGRDLWLFAAEEDLTPETFLAQPVWYAAGSDSPLPLIRL